MSYISVKEASKKWGITERVVRQYCADGRIPGAFITGNVERRILSGAGDTVFEDIAV